ncbi:MAG: cupin domain-containing protein [Methanobacteriota archaeon]|nr:MAG: cupin domain-containing protein [Euryarchaeota archaeon]
MIELERLRVRADRRGRLEELYRTGPRRPRVEEVYRITFRRSAIRGGHFHRRKHEFVLILRGTLECTLYRPRGDVLERVRLGPRSGLLHVPPGVGHQFRNIGSAPAQALVLATVRYDVARPDKVPARPFVSGRIGRLSNPQRGGLRKG